MIRTNHSGVMTIDLFNKLTGHETLHPLICTVDLSETTLREDIRMTCDFYGLLYYNDSEQEKRLGNEWLRLIYPGEVIVIPSGQYRCTESYSGVLFHPDLLCDTPLEKRIETYRKRCCKGTLSEHERQIITDNLREIGQELHHAIDRYSAAIIASHIELLLNYCVRFCSQ